MMNARTIRMFTKFLRSAEAIYKNPDKVKKVFEDVDGKVENNSPLEQIFVKSKLASKMVLDFITGKYKKVPKRSILVIIAAALYISSPIDAIFDFIPFVGFADDIFIFSLIYKQISKDLADYLQWSNLRNGNTKLNTENINNPNSIKISEELMENDGANSEKQEFIDVDYSEINGIKNN